MRKFIVIRILKQLLNYIEVYGPILQRQIAKTVSSGGYRSIAIAAEA
jgi:hypothetical protein